MSRVLITVCLLIGSNIFMTWAWYGHLKKPSWGILTAVLVSWLIAFPEYLLQVPANRIGHTSNGGPLSAAQLKVIQEAITLVVFMGFAMLVLKERLRINELIAFGLIFCAVIIAMMGRKEPPTSKESGAPYQHVVPALEESDPQP